MEKMINPLYGELAFYWLPALILCVAKDPSERGHKLHSVSEVNGRCLLHFLSSKDWYGEEVLCRKCILRKSLRKQIGDLQGKAVRLRSISDKKINSILNAEIEIRNKSTIHGRKGKLM